jgi:hypothetical protein
MHTGAGPLPSGPFAMRLCAICFPPVACIALLKNWRLQKMDPKKNQGPCSTFQEHSRRQRWSRGDPEWTWSMPVTWSMPLASSAASSGVSSGVSDEVLTLANGDTYGGEMLDGRPHGRGPALHAELLVSIRSIAPLISLPPPSPTCVSLSLCHYLFLMSLGPWPHYNIICIDIYSCVNRCIFVWGREECSDSARASDTCKR